MGTRDCTVPGTALSQGTHAWPGLDRRSFLAVMGLDTGLDFSRSPTLECARSFWHRKWHSHRLRRPKCVPHHSLLLHTFILFPSTTCVLYSRRPLLLLLHHIFQIPDAPGVRGLLPAQPGRMRTAKGTNTTTTYCTVPSTYSAGFGTIEIFVY